MDYRMYEGPVPANKNVVTLIAEDLKTKGITVNTPLKFVGFEGPVATKFKLNNHQESTKIPICGNFCAPFCGDRYMPVYSLVFEQSFDGDIYYII